MTLLTSTDFYTSNSISILNSNSPAFFQNVLKVSESKQVNIFKTSEELIKSEINCNVVFLKRKININTSRISNTFLHLVALMQCVD